MRTEEEITNMLLNSYSILRKAETFPKRCFLIGKIRALEDILEYNWTVAETIRRIDKYERECTND